MQVGALESALCRHELAGRGRCRSRRARVWRRAVPRCVPETARDLLKHVCSERDGTCSVSLDPARRLVHRGIAGAGSRLLITQRSQVQILPPLPIEGPDAHGPGLRHDQALTCRLVGGRAGSLDRCTTPAANPGDGGVYPLRRGGHRTHGPTHASRMPIRYRDLPGARA